MLLLVTILKGLSEVVLLALLGQAALALLAGRSREGNPIYRTFRTVTGPIMRAVRFITPGVVLDRHIPLVAFFLMVTLWLALTVAKAQLLGVIQLG